MPRTAWGSCIAKALVSHRIIRKRFAGIDGRRNGGCAGPVQPGGYVPQGPWRAERLRPGPSHMWANLAVAQGYENAIKICDLLEELMTPDQLAEVQRLAREWKPRGK